jgi:hypothetical protein
VRLLRIAFASFELATTVVAAVVELDVVFFLQKGEKAKTKEQKTSPGSLKKLRSHSEQNLRLQHSISKRRLRYKQSTGLFCFVKNETEQ